MRRSVVIRLSLLLLLAVLPGMTGCNGFFVPVCVETDTCPAPVAGVPTVTSISPTSGPVAGGTSVTITGTNFTGATAVSFGSTAVTNGTVNSAGTQIVVTSPAASSSGTVYVTVTTPGGTSATSSASQFTYGSAAASYIYVANATASTLTALSLSSGTLTALSGSPYTLGTAPSAVAITPSGSLLYVASSSGNVYVYTVAANGSLTLGNSGNPVTSLLNPSYMTVDKTGTWLFLISQSLTQMSEYQINPTTGVLTAPAGTPTSTVTLSSNPAQIYITPNNQYVYVGEDPSSSGSSVGGTDIFTLDATNGALSNPLHFNAKNPSSGGDNAISSDANSKFLFVGETDSGSNGVSGVRVFTIGTGGSVTEITGSPFTNGLYLDPIAIAMDPTNAYVYVASHASNNITGYSLGSTGALTLLTTSPFTAGTTLVAMSLDATKQYMVVIASGGNPDLQVFSFDATSPGKLDPIVNSATGTTPISMAVAQ